ncbi:MAG: hypothetical protein JW751_26300 [Polyangiaceae bacterium]|nr:hypothetical protein [Polyangiaceae bacterium]
MEFHVSEMMGCVAMAALLVGCGGSAAGGGSGKPAPLKTGAAATSACGFEAMVDDCEDNDHQVIVQKGRSGYWYTYVDESGSKVEPAPEKAGGGKFFMSAGGANGSKYAARMWGSTATSGNAYPGMGLSLTDPKGLYDASMYGGLKFFAKMGPGSSSKVRLKMADIQTDKDGGKCKECYNDFGVTFDVSETWTEYVLPFELAKQEPYWGDEFSRIMANQLYSLQWQVSTNSVTFDIWVDDVSFVGCDSVEGAPAAAPVAPVPPPATDPAATPAE